MNRFTTFAALLFLNSAAAVAADEPSPPQRPCGQYAELTQRLIRSGAARVVTMSTGATMIDIWQGSNNAWTAFEVRSDGQMCRVDGGPGRVHTAKPTCLDPVKCPRI